MTTTDSTPTARRRWIPWLVLAIGLAWTASLRIPLILNAEDHLDSDLAVDGLTLLDAVHGHWRWHYPGTPHMGILPVLASYPQAVAWGANPITLVSGGTVLWVLVVVSTFALARRTFGAGTAAWVILPLVFSSIGTIWLSGRITGGHLLALAWHASVFLGFDLALAHRLAGAVRSSREGEAPAEPPPTPGSPGGSPSRKRGWRASALLGLWCGLGIYVDAMLIATIAGIAAVSLGRLRGGSPRSRLAIAGAFLVGLLVGVAPREIGRLVDPHDAYPAQFAATFDIDALEGHANLLAWECLPRLIAGTGFSAKPDAARAIGIWLMLGLFAAAIVRLAAVALSAEDSSRRDVARGTLASGVIVVASFIVNKNIYNSDNYRYLIFLLTPWCLGFGLLMADLCRCGSGGRVSAGLIAMALAVGMTGAAVRWYRDTRHYLDDRGWPVRREVPPWSELVVLPDRPGERVRRFTIPDDVTHVFGGYWDVYRLSFVSGKRLVGVPYPMYPNRFRGWSDGLRPGRGKIMILRPGEPAASGSRPAAEMTGIRPGRVASARGIAWRRMFATSWAADGRDPGEIGRIAVEVP